MSHYVRLSQQTRVRDHLCRTDKVSSHVEEAHMAKNFWQLLKLKVASQTDSGLQWTASKNSGPLVILLQANEFCQNPNEFGSGSFPSQVYDDTAALQIPGLQTP